VHAAVPGQHRQRVLGRARVERVDRAVEGRRERAAQARALGQTGAHEAQGLGRVVV
jgi:hypothetical protein